MSKDCLFCKIISKEIPSHILYENDDTMAFLDIHPVNPGHTLIVPKKHSEDILDTPEDTFLPLVLLMKKIGRALIEMGYDGFNIMQNSKPASGQVIPHLHWHVIPRKEGDGFRHWSGREYKEGEAEEILKKFNELL